MPVTLTGEGLTIEAVARVARGREAVALAAGVVERLRRSRAVVDDAISSGAVVYGVNTGFGELKNRSIPPAKIAELQRNLLRSHAAGVGTPLPAEVVRAIGLLRAESLAVGVSGVRPEVVETLLATLNAGVHPVIPEQGSVGASGDLAPLAHYALVLIGEGEAEHDGVVVPGGEALRRARIAPLVLGPKEGLALINGTQQSTATLALALADAEELVIAAVGAAALTVEGLLGSVVAFDERVQRARPHPGQAWVAETLRALLEGSEIGHSHAECGRIQDPYSVRCAPQVIGASCDALAYARAVCERELASATDNPLVFPDAPAGARWNERVVSAGNFHAQPVSLAADVAAAAIASVASIAERRLDLLLDEKKSGLPAFLAADPGLHSGWMLVQYTAAALVSENKTLAHPASVDSIPTSAGMEDHVSMAPWAARKLRRVIENVRRVVAAEYLLAAAAVEHRAPLAPAAATGALLAAVRERVARLDADRPPAPDLESLARWIEAGGVRTALHAAGFAPRDPFAPAEAPVAGRSR